MLVKIEDELVSTRRRLSVALVLLIWICHKLNCCWRGVTLVCFLQHHSYCTMSQLPVALDHSAALRQSSHPQPHSEAAAFPITLYGEFPTHPWSPPGKGPGFSVICPIFSSSCLISLYTLLPRLVLGTAPGLSFSRFSAQEVPCKLSDSSQFFTYLSTRLVQIQPS